MRVQKYISQCGFASRRKAEQLIEQGRVSINGEVLRQQGTRVDPQQDVVKIDQEVVGRSGINPVYLVLNKPRAIMSTLFDPEGRATLAHLVSEINERIYPIGRLDYLSEGLIIMTNDGQLAQDISHPKNEVPKVYEVKVFGRVNQKILKSLRNGIISKVGPLKPQGVRVIKELPQKTWLEFRLLEGKNREIRRLCEFHGLTIDKLKRVAIGDLTIEGLSPGTWRLYSKRALLRKLGSGVCHYFSPKKSIRMGRRKIDEGLLAGQKKFSRYRKETYYKTLEGQIRP